MVKSMLKRIKKLKDDSFGMVLVVFGMDGKYYKNHQRDIEFTNKDISELGTSDILVVVKKASDK